VLAAAAMCKLLVLVFVLSVGVVASVMLSQTRVLFPTDAVPPGGPLPPGAERLSLETSDGDRLQGVYIPPTSEDPTATPQTLIVGFGGNAWNGQDVAATLSELFPKAHVAAFHYRGYRPSTGRPSAASLLGDAPLVLDAAASRVKPTRTIVVGFSIGSGIAASLARRRPLDGMILVTPFDSLKSVAAGLFPWLPIGPFFAHEIEARAYLEGSQVPVAIVAAGEDEIIRRERTDALRAKVPNLVFDRTVAGATHNDLYVRPEFRTAMRAALQALTTARPDHPPS
jgi:uncharacterized protein